MNKPGDNKKECETENFKKENQNPSWNEMINAFDFKRVGHQMEEMFPMHSLLY